MIRRPLLLVALLLATVSLSTLPAQETAPRSAKEALQAFNDLIGSWRGTGTPTGTREEQQKNFWTETLAWQWHFQGKDAWLKVDFDKSKHFTGGELRYDPAHDQFVLTMRTPSQEKQTFTGKLDKRVLALQHEQAGENQRLVITLLHPNRFLYRYEVRPAGKTLYSKKYQVGATKEGVPFADGDGRPECIVSGGLGTIPVTFRGLTYYVCCSGCRSEFQAEPEKYVKEYEAKKARPK
jgi:hypothetical protein